MTPTPHIVPNFNGSKLEIIRNIELLLGLLWVSLSCRVAWVGQVWQDGQSARWVQMEYGVEVKGYFFTS